MASSQDSSLVISFRDYLQKKLAEFVAGFPQIELAADLLTEFVLLLGTYQEEGTHLYPAVFLGDRLDEILEITAGCDALAIGHGEQSLETVRQAIKQCAPLAEAWHWAIYVCLTKGGLTYGIFRTDQSPLNPTPFERLRQTARPGIKMLGLTRLGGSFVEVRGADGRFHYVNLSGLQAGTPVPIEVVRHFTRVVTRDVPDALRPQLESFYYRVGVDILHANHGTLLAVIDRNHEVPSLFDDGVLLRPRMNVVDEVTLPLCESSHEAFQRAFAWNVLIRRMTAMDGSTVLDSRGAVVAYNCFIHSSALEPYARSTTVGGARRRAFEVLQSKLGEQVLAVIYKSQDGRVEFGVSD